MVFTFEHGEVGGRAAGGGGGGNNGVIEIFYLISRSPKTNVKIHGLKHFQFYA